MTDNISGTVDLSGTLGLLEAGEHAFSLRVTDGLGQSVDSDVYTAQTNGATFEWLPFDGAAWATHIETGATVADANPAKFSTQIYRNGRWEDLSESRTVSEDGDRVDLKLRSLMLGTELLLTAV